MNTSPADSTLAEYSGPLGRCRRWLASPWMILVAVLSAVALVSPAVRNGLEADDIYHRAVMSGSPRFSKYMGGPQAMFRFLHGDPRATAEMMDLGFLPWWSHPGIKAEFLQFLTVQTHVLDYWLWPDRPALMHAHSIAWLALMVLLAAIGYRRLLGATWVAGLAALLFAVDDAHATPVGWVCNRNDLVAASFGIACLMAHDRWRRGKRWPAFGAAVVLWACSLCAKEAGIGTCAYLFAYAVWLDGASWWRRFLTLVPYGLVLVVWRTVRDQLGYGVQDLGFYVDPLGEPLRFLAALVERYPVCLLGQWGLPPSDLSILVPRLLGSPLWWSGVAVMVALAVLFGPLLRRDPAARFFATGMLLATVPICATFPSDRLLTFVGVGAMGLLACFWQFTVSRQAERPRSVLWRGPALGVLVLLGTIHLLAAPFLLTVRARNPVGPDWFNRSLYIDGAFDPVIEEQDLIVLNPPSVMHANYYALVCEHNGWPVPRRLRALAPGMGPLTVVRPDDRTLVITPRGGYMTFFLDRLFRNEYHPLRAGEQIRLTGLTITVLALTTDNRPATVAFRFERPLEDASWRWLRWQRGKFRPYQPPGAGEEQTIASDWPPVAEIFTRSGPPDDWTD